MSLPVDDFLDVVAKAEEKEAEDRAWGMWLAQYPHMTKETFEPFERFLMRMRVPTKKPRPAEELLAEAAAIQKAVRGEPS